MKENCFANRKDGECHALIKKQCEGCKFYKAKERVKNNPFYAFSYLDKERHKKDIEKYRIKKEQVLN